MRTVKGRYTITYNSEIYNYKELRRLLESDKRDALFFERYTLYISFGIVIVGAKCMDQAWRIVSLKRGAKGAPGGENVKSNEALAHAGSVG